MKGGKNQSCYTRQSWMLLQWNIPAIQESCRGKFKLKSFAVIIVIYFPLAYLLFRFYFRILMQGMVFRTGSVTSMWHGYYPRITLRFRHYQCKHSYFSWQVHLPAHLYTKVSCSCTNPVSVIFPTFLQSAGTWRVLTSMHCLETLAASEVLS